MRLFTCTVCMWWNVTSWVPICRDVHMASVSIYLLLLVPSAHRPLPVSALFHNLCSAHFLLLLLWPATTLEVSLLPTFVVFCISSGVLLLWVWKCCYTAVARLACTLTTVFFCWSLLAVFHPYYVSFTYAWVLKCSGYCGSVTQTLYYVELPVWIVYFWSYLNYICGYQLIPNFDVLHVYSLVSQP